MALTQTVQLTDNFDERITFQNAYIKVIHVSSTKEMGIITYKLFKGQSEKELVEKVIQFPIDLEGPNPIKQAYLYLKTLPEFADAIDC